MDLLEVISMFWNYESQTQSPGWLHCCSASSSSSSALLDPGEKQKQTPRLHFQTTNEEEHCTRPGLSESSELVRKQRAMVKNQTVCSGRVMNFAQAKILLFRAFVLHFLPRCFKILTTAW
jgi:hypothetical protein